MIPLILSAAMSAFALIPLTTIVLDLRDDATEAKDLLRLTEPLPPPRQRLAFPEPVSPMDLPARWDTQALASVELVNSRARHRIGEAPGTVAQRARWNTPTGQFWLIVEQLGDLEEPCSHCAAPEDGERPHVLCPGCACPCGTAPPLPDGVEGHAIAGRTR